MRGDRPLSKTGLRVKCAVYPACAGIDHELRTEEDATPSLPRMRGDRPLFFASFESGKLFTPHARGSTQGRRGGFFRGAVYPACAGIDLQGGKELSKEERLPRMRGDRPKEED